MLSEQDIAQLRDAVAAGKPATVWFTAKAVGVEVGKSGKVLSFAEPAVGDFIEVKPTGSQDALSFGKAELTLTRPKRPPAPKKPAPAAAQAPASASASADVPAEKPAAAGEPEIYQPAPAEKPAKQRARRQSSKPPVEVTVTLHSTARGDWTVEVVVGSKRTVRALPVPAGIIAKVARQLPSQVEDAISAVMAAARQQHEERIALLQAELDAARRALGELS